MNNELFVAHTIIKRVQKIWGIEEWIVNEKGYCGKKLTVNKGCRCSLHCHKKKAETFYVLSGSGWIETHGINCFVIPGMIIDIKPGQYHRFSTIRPWGTTDELVLIEFSTHHEDDDVVRKEESCGQTK